MQQDALRRIRRMTSDQFEQALVARAGTRGVASSEKELRDYFGDDEFTYLQKLAQHSVRTRSRAPLKGNIVFLPGIMGSELTTIQDGDDDVVWTNYARRIRSFIFPGLVTTICSRGTTPARTSLFSRPSTKP